MNRTEIFTDGCRVDQTKNGGWATVILKSASGSQPNTSSNEMELKAMVEAIKMAEGPCTVISDQQGIVKNAKEGKCPNWCRALWEEMYAAMAGKDVSFEWRGRDKSLGQRIAHQLSRDAARGK